MQVPLFDRGAGTKRGDLDHHNTGCACARSRTSSASFHIFGAIIPHWICQYALSNLLPGRPTPRWISISRARRSHLASQSDRNATRSDRNFSTMQPHERRVKRGQCRDFITNLLDGANAKNDDDDVYYSVYYKRWRLKLEGEK